MPDFVPQIEEDTVKQLVIRDYPAEVTDRVFSMLAEYGTKPDHVERAPSGFRILLSLKR